MDRRRRGIGGWVRILVPVALAVALLVGAAAITGVVGAPSVVGVENSFGPVDETHTVVHTDLRVHNPNPVGVRFGDVAASYTVRMNDVALADGHKEGVSLSTGTDTIAFETRMDNRRIPEWWVSHLRRGERTTLTVDAAVSAGPLDRQIRTTPVERTITTDVLGQFNSTDTRAVNVNSPLIRDPVAYVNRTNATWGTVTEERTPIHVAFLVYNPKDVPLPLAELGYDVSMNGIDVGEGRTNQTRVVPPRSATLVEATVVLDNRRLDEWWVSHVRRNQVTTLEIDFHATFDLGATDVRVPLRDVSYETEIETDLFGTKSGATSAAGTTTDAGGSTTAGTSTTAVPTAATTGTAPSETTPDGTADDGGLLAVRALYAPFEGSSFS